MNNEVATTGTDICRIEREARGFAGNCPQFLAQAWQGTLFSNERNSMKLSESSELSNALQSAVQKELSDVPPEQMRLLLDHAKVVMLCFLQNKETVVNIDENGLVDLARIAIASCKDPQFLEDLEIRIGFGSAPLASPNARVPAYTIAAKRMLDSLSEGRERAEILSVLDLIAEKFPANKFGKLRTNILLGRPLSPEQAQLLSNMQQTLEGEISAETRGQAEQQVPFPKQLPRVVLYSAHNFVGRTNGASEAVHSCAEANMRYLRAFIREACSPEIAAQFHFDEDREVEEASVLNRMIEYFAHACRMATDECTIQAREKILAFGKKHAEGNEEGSLQYGVSHALYAADPVRLPGVQMLRDASAKPRKLIMLGGEPEKVFWRLRQSVCREATPEGSIEYFRERMEEIGVLANDSGYPQALRHVEEGQRHEENDMRRVQLISKVGEIPVYSGEMEGMEPSTQEIVSMSFEDLMQRNMGRTSVKEDLFHLIAELGDAPPAAVRGLAKGKSGDQEVVQAMVKGLERLRCIIASAQ
ncbi:MAG: hypothetical protein M0P69_04755 [Bacteroidales bacterium]|nr:hypothetical protein [Bacteroidales bacterium]